MRWSLVLAVLLITVSVSQSYASESNDTLDPRFGDKVGNQNCILWFPHRRCMRTITTHMLVPGQVLLALLCF